MTRKAPKVRIRGIRQKTPSGVVFGRSSKGNGQPEMMSRAQLRAVVGLSPGGITSQVNASELFDGISAVHGSILYRNATEWVALAPGTDTHVLATHGVAADPTWVAPTAVFDPLAVASHILPSVDATYNLGAAAKRWLVGYINTITDGATGVGSLLTTASVLVEHGKGTDWTGQAFYIGGVEKMRLNANGLGVGMTPSGILDAMRDANGAARIYVLNPNAGTNAYVSLTADNGTTTANMYLLGNNWTTTGFYRQNGMLLETSGAGGLSLNTASVQPIRFGINSVEKMQLNANGLGIGATATANFNLNITTNQNTNSGVLITNTDGGTAAEVRHQFTNGSANMLLRLFGTGFTTSGLNRQDGAMLTVNGAGGLTFNTGANQPIYFGINDTEVAKINASGLGIGETASTENILNIARTQNSALVAKIANANAGTTASSFLTASNATSDTHVVQWGTGFTTTGVNRQGGGMLYANGPGGLTLCTGSNQPIYFAINNTEMMQLTATGLGIGMTPVNVFDITKNQNSSATPRLLNNDAGTGAYTGWTLSNGTAGAALYLFGTGYTTAGIERQNGALLQNTGAGGMTINTAANQPIYFGVNSTQIAMINAAGLGIGMTPVNVLDITQNTSGAARISVLNSNSGTGALSAFVMDNGTSAGIYYQFGSGYTTSGMRRQNGTFLMGDGAGGFTINTGANQPLYFGVNDAEKMRLTGTGLSIGGAAPATSAKLDLQGTDGALLVTRLTTAQRDALTASNGMMIYNTDTVAFEIRKNGAWVALSSSSVPSGDSDWYWAGPNALGNQGSSAEPCRGSMFTLKASIKVAAFIAACTTVAGATYRGAIYEVNSSNAIVAVTADTADISSPGAVTRASVLCTFSSPVTLNAGTKYAICFRRTDGGDTAVLGMFGLSGGLWYEGVPVDTPNAIACQYVHIAKANPAAADTFGTVGTGCYYAQLKMCLA